MGPAIVCEPTTFSIRNDLEAIRRTLKTVRESYHFTNLCLFGRRNPTRVLEYFERRSYDRSAIEMPLYVTPVTFDGQVARVDEGDPCDLFAMSKEVSLRGVGFTHDHSFEAEYAVVAFDLLESAEVALLLDIRWLNLVQGDVYMSGGRFIGIAEEICD